MSEQTPRGTVIVLSSIRWNFSWQGRHEISAGFARRGYDVLYLEPLPLRWWPGTDRLKQHLLARLLKQPDRMEKGRQAPVSGVEVIWPVGAPDRLPPGLWINRRILMPRLARRLRRTGPTHPLIIFNYLPTSAWLALQRQLAPDVVVYGCTDDYPNSPYLQDVPLVEDNVVDSADIVYVTSPALLARMQQKHDNVIHLLPAVHYEQFEPARAPHPLHDPPLCVYFGTLSRTNNDYDLLREVSHRYRLKVIGPVVDPLEGFAPATEAEGPVPYDDLPGALADADVLLLPYIKTEYMGSVIPAKTFQCLATGKPVVSIGLSSMETLRDVVDVCDTHEEFLAAIQAAAHDSPARRGARLAAAQANTWDARIDLLESAARRVLTQKGYASG